MARSHDRVVEPDAESRAATTREERDEPGESSVGWRDLSTNSSSDGLAASPTADTEVVKGAAVTDRIRSHAGSALTIETDRLTATLVGVPTVSIAELIYSHHRDAVADTGAVRHCAMFDVENTGDRRLHRLSRHTTFIGSDGSTYDRAPIALNTAELAPGCHTNHVVIEPRCSARVITPVEQLPQGVDVATVVHTVALIDAPNQRLRYTL